MRKLCLMLLAVFSCGVSLAGKWENARSYYDNSEIVYSMPLPAKIKVLSYIEFVWQLVTPHGRGMAQGKVNWQLGRKIAKVPLKFDELKPGISLKCVLQLKLNGKVVAQQRIIIYSKKIFKSIAGKLKKLGAGAILPEDEIARLNVLGMGLPKKTLSGFGDTANKVIFCSAKKYLDNVDMLSILMKRGVTLVMFAPVDESEIFLPLKSFSNISLISSKNAKTKGSLGVICNKEKIAVACASGQGGLIKIKYGKGKIIIVADSVYKALEKSPDAALMLKNNLLK
jgi:hypothetical protein